MKKILLVFFILGITIPQVYAHSGKPKYHIIIDTDGAIDDLRAISMFLGSNDIRVLAITCSQGSLMPLDVYSKITSLLNTYHHQGIKVAISDSVNFPKPQWYNFANSIIWGDTSINQNIKPESSLELLNKSTKDYKPKIILIALGSLKTYADWINNNPEIIDKIDKIIWYNSINISDGFNYKVSPESFEMIKNSGINLQIVQNTTKYILVSNEYLDELNKQKSVYSEQIIKVHQQSEVEKKIKEKHLFLWDDLVPLYLSVPMLFETKTTENITTVVLSNSIPASIINKTIAEILISATKTNNRVFTEFPIDTNLYKKEYAEILSKTIDAYGLIEWKAIAMTNEIHGHTGIYSIIGAKMGIRAMEYFNVGVNNLYVTTYAGKEPPLSCFNDGIQISTGSTIGQGLITISDTVLNIPTAVFEFNGQKVKFSVKQEIADQMKQEIKTGVIKYGALTDKYWLYIEELAIKYWATYNRNEIIEIEKL